MQRCFQTIVSFCVLAAAALAAQPRQNEPIPILASNFDGPYPDGSYSYNYQTGNGIQAQEQGEVVRISPTEDALHVQGSFSYSDHDGKSYGLGYIADENGFQPKGDHLPTPPPVPIGILKALEYIAKHPEEDHLRKWLQR